MYVKASNTDFSDELGRSVAISGDTLVVAAPVEDGNATGVNGNEADNSAASAGPPTSSRAPVAPGASRPTSRHRTPNPSTSSAFRLRSPQADGKAFAAVAVESSDSAGNSTSQSARAKIRLR